MGRWRAVIEHHESYDELILWFEHDLFDQLNLIQLLAWIRERLPAAKVVSLVCIGSFPGHPQFKGLGELTPDELASLLETRQRVGDAQYSLAELAWQAFREPTPEALDEPAPRGHWRRCRISRLLSRASCRNIRGPPTDSLEPSGGCWNWQPAERWNCQRHSHACTPVRTSTTSPTCRS